MSLHRLNTSRTVRSGKGGGGSGRRRGWSIHWRVHLVFPGCEGAEYDEERYVVRTFIIIMMLRFQF